jgi:hypothetical protein
MANYYAAARTNYVSLKEGLTVEDFRGHIDAIGLPSVEVIEKNGKVGLLSEDPDSGSFPSFLCPEWETEDDLKNLSQALGIPAEGLKDMEEIEFSWAAHIMPLVKEGEVFIVMESGAEKLRYIVGFAEAYVRQGDEVKFTSINITEIYSKAAVEFGIPVEQIEPAEY